MSSEADPATAFDNDGNDNGDRLSDTGDTGDSCDKQPSPTKKSDNDDSQCGAFKSDKEQTLDVEPRLFRRRWWIISLFVGVALTNAYQWIHVNIIADKILFYYNASLPDSVYQQNVSNRTCLTHR